MDLNKSDPHPPDEDGNYSWPRHAAWNAVPVEQFPPAPGPMIYEGFIPQSGQHQSVYASHYPVSQSHNGHAPNHQHPQYPPLDQNDFYSGFSGGPVQSPMRGYDQGYPTNPTTSGVHLPSSSLHSIPQLESTGHDDETSIDEDENFSSREIRLESEIENTPVSVRGRGQGRKRGRGRGRGSRRSNQNVRGGRNKGTRTGTRAVLDPGKEFDALHKEATEAFIDQQDYDRASQLILKAIAINPEIYSAHVLLSEIYFAKGNEEKGVAILFSGAHASPNDPAVWHQLADVCLQVSSMDRLTMLKQASYCFQRLLQIDQQDHDARFQKAAISRELGHHAKALKDLDILLQKMPHNSSILRQIAEICLDLNDVGRAIGLYDDALEHQKLSVSLDEEEEEEGFTWADLIVYVDLIARSNDAFKAVQVLKNIARWLVGREDEAYWADFTDDDREWDAEHQPRRVQLSSFDANCHPVETYGIGLPLELRIKLGDLRLKSGHRQEALVHFEWLCPEDRDEGAPLYEYSDLFLQVADALREVKAFEQALRYYEALHSVDAYDDVEFWLGLGACSYVCEKRDQALRCYEEAKRVDPTSGEARTQLSKLYADRGDREQALILARSAITIYKSQLPQTERRKYEPRGLREAREAAQQAYEEAYRISRPQNANDAGSKARPSRKRARDKTRRLAREAAIVEASIAAEGRATGQDQAELDQRPASLTPPRRQEGLYDREEALRNLKRKARTKRDKIIPDRHNKVQQLYSTMCGVPEMTREGDDVARNIWMDCADSLVEIFCSEKAFYPGERYLKFEGFDRPPKKSAQAAVDESGNQAQEDIPMPSVESTVPNDFCGIEFTKWLDVFLEYAMLLANIHEDRLECYRVINASIDCNIWYHDPDAMFQIHACWLACAMALQDETTLFNTVLRWFMREYVFCTDMYRLFGAMNFYYPLPNDKGGKAGQMNNAIFRAGPNQKFLFRQIMGIDNQLPEGYGSDQPDGPVPDFMRRSGDMIYMEKTYRQSEAARFPTQDEAADVEDDEALTPAASANTGDQPAHRTYSPSELDVVLLVVYGQILYAGGSFPNALSYFYRAYNLQPKNSMVLLSIALSYIHQMLKRQNENRHMYLLQGWSFFQEYAEARSEWARQEEKEGRAGLLVVVKREIEFNRARCWQMLGMSNLAIQSYERMMDLKSVKAEEETSMDVDSEYKGVFNLEAAYAMATMYAVNGDMDSARLITEKYLVIE